MCTQYIMIVYGKNSTNYTFRALEFSIVIKNFFCGIIINIFQMKHFQENRIQISITNVCNGT